jgi:uridine kinase
MTRQAVLSAVAQQLAARDPGRPLRVGIDGVCGVGKTTFAAELAGALAPLGRPVLHVDSDGFHHVRAIRHRQGRESARGYYEDAYDLDGLRELVLVPLAAGPPYRYATRIHDLVTDAQVREHAVAPADAIVLFAATFLQRGDLRRLWDEVIYLDAAPQVAQARGVARDASALGGVDAATSAYETRYMAACALYVAEQQPRERASILVDHDDPADPAIVRD